MPKIDKDKLRKFIAEECEDVGKLKKQLTDSQIVQLGLHYTKAEIRDTLLEMENFNGLDKKYKSVFLTIRNWIELKRKKTKVAQSNQLKRLGLNAKMEHSEALTYLERKGLPLSSLQQKFAMIKDDNGKTYWQLKEEV